MMTEDNEFEKKIRELVGSYTETPDEDFWDTIEKGIRAKNRIALVKKFSIICSAAAVVVAGLFFAFRSVNNLPLNQSSAIVRLDDNVKNGNVIMADAVSDVSAVNTNVSAVTKDVDVNDGADDGADVGASVSASVKTDIAAGAGVESDAVDSCRKTVGQESLNTEDVYKYNLYMAENCSESSSAKVHGGGIVLSASGNLSVFGASAEKGYQGSGIPGFSYGDGKDVSRFQGISPVSKPTHSIPVSAAIEVGYSFLDDMLAVGTGVSYTYMSSRYEAVVDNSFQADVFQSVHYIGVPLLFTYNFVRTDHFFVYATLGGSVEKAVKVSYSLKDLSNSVSYRNGNFPGVDCSAVLGVGFEYRFLKYMGVYLNPRVSWYFIEKSPYSAIRENPFQVSFQLGLRFHL
ncbi:MAG: outer membrane beta-barrel protein [Candidatus Coprenecus sp.]|nr:outer membrane beta-barrel protein [Candidatus Coprenecus sp.]